MVSMNEMMEMALAFDDKNLPIKHIPVRPAFLRQPPAPPRHDGH